MDAFGAQPATRRLTAKQREFVHSIAILRLGPSEAYRKNYCSFGSPKSIASQAFRLLRSPTVRRAIADIENVDSSTKPIFAEPRFAAVLKIKRLHQIAQDPSTPAYVAVRALELMVECERGEASRREAEAKQSSKQRQEELMRKLSSRKPTDFEIAGDLEDFSNDLRDVASPIGRSAVSRSGHMRK